MRVDNSLMFSFENHSAHLNYTVFPSSPDNVCIDGLSGTTGSDILRAITLRDACVEYRSHQQAHGGFDVCIISPCETNRYRVACVWKCGANGGGGVGGAIFNWPLFGEACKAAMCSNTHRHRQTHTGQLNHTTHVITFSVYFPALWICMRLWLIILIRW